MSADKTIGEFSHFYCVFGNWIAGGIAKVEGPHLLIADVQGSGRVI
jgi:hypothetical protein